MNTQPCQAIESKGSFAIFPHKGEFAVAHVGHSRPFGSEVFQASWVIDTVCPTVELAVDALDTLVAENKRRKLAELQEMSLLSRISHET